MGYGVQGCEDEGGYGCNGVQNDEGLDQGVADQVDELEETGQDDCEELVEDDRVEVEEGSFEEGDFHMSIQFGVGKWSWFIFPDSKNDVEK